MFKVVNPYY